MKKNKLLFPVTSLIVLSGSIIPLVSCGAPQPAPQPTNLIKITFQVEGGHGSITGGVEITANKGIKWNDVVTPQYMCDEGYCLSGWFNGENEMKANDVITTNLTISAKFCTATDPSNFKWVTNASSKTATIDRLTEKGKNLVEMVVPKTYKDDNGITYIVNSIAGIVKEMPNLKSLTIRNNITKIGVSSFCDCPNIETIKIENNPIYNDGGNNANCIIETETNCLIVGCKTSIIPNTVTTINSRAFSGCYNLTSITLPNSVTTIKDYAFAECINLASIQLSQSLKEIEDSAFYNCENLSEVVIPDSVEKMDRRVFYGCTKLTSVTLGSKLKKIDTYTFYQCSNLKQIFIPKNITYIYPTAFELCISLESINIDNENEKYYSGGDNGNCIIEKDTNKLIYGCKNTHIPDGVEIIGESAFFKCSNLAAITIPQTVTKIESNPFMGCTGLESIEVDSNNQFYTSQDNAKNECNCIIEISQTNKTLIVGCKDTTIPNDTTIIGKNAFAYCSTLKSIIIPDSVKIIDFCAFSECDNLNDTTISIPASVTEISGSAFDKCNVKTISIPKSVTALGTYAFASCTSLEEINIETLENIPEEWDTKNAFEDICEQGTLYVKDGLQNSWKEYFEKWIIFDENHWKIETSSQK